MGCLKIKNTMLSEVTIHFLPILVVLALIGSCEGKDPLAEVGSYLRMVITLIVVLLGVAIVISIIFWIWKTYGRGRYQGTAQCYLCLERVPQNEWSSGEHRRQCSSTSFKYEKMMKHPSKKCPLCHQHLRQWPQLEVYLLDYFKCYSGECGEREVINNTGDNRFTCFACDVSFCQQCAASGRDDNKVLGSVNV